MSAQLLLPSSKADHPPYPMERLADGTWGHADSSCGAFQNGKPCSHPDKAAAMFAELAGNPRVDAGAVPMVVDNLQLAKNDDLARVLIEWLPNPGNRLDGTHPWVYAFKQQGKMVVGLSADAIEDACRALAFRGEAIRCTDVILDFHDEKVAYFRAVATTYAISPSGQEIATRATTRGKHVNKFNISGTFNENWYEHGMTKAARNAEEALIPEILKNNMIKMALETVGGPRQLLIAQGEDPDEEGPPPQQPPKKVEPPPPPPVGAKWEELTFAQVAYPDSPIEHQWARSIFKDKVEALIGANRCRGSVLKLELANPEPGEPQHPPLGSIDGTLLGAIVEALAQKHGKGGPPASDVAEATYTEHKAEKE